LLDQLASSFDPRRDIVRKISNRELALHGQEYPRYG
jgi:hypothetical protein